MRMRVEDDIAREQVMREEIQATASPAPSPAPGRVERPLAAVAGQHPDLITRVVLQ